MGRRLIRFVAATPGAAMPLGGSRRARSSVVLAAVGFMSALLASPASAVTASVSPTSLTFGAQAIGTTSAAKTITLSNTAAGTLSISSVTFTGDFARSGGSCGSSLKSRRNCTIGVVFRPTAQGTRTGSVSIADNATTSPQTVTLTGTGAGPDVSVAPSSLTFPSQAVGSTSPTSTLTLTNTGTASLTISSVTTSGDFARLGGTCASSLAAGASCTIGVTFTPTASGARTGAVAITDNAAGSPQSIPLQGVGASPGVSISPTSLTFDPQAINTTSLAKQLTVTNSGTAPLTVTSVTATGEFSANGQTCTTAPLPIGGSCVVSVTFTPLASGTRAGSVTLAHNATGSPQTIPLTGQGTGTATLTVDKDSTNLGTVTVGSTSTPETITVTNTGDAASGPISTALNGAGFQATGNTCLGVALAAHATCTVTLTFTTTATGPSTGTLTITGTPGGQTVTNLVGTGRSALCSAGSSVYTAAHEDDTLLFESPDVLHDIQAGRCVKTIFLTAGDAGLNSTYWLSREQGAMAGYANLAGVANAWTTGDAGIPGHPIPLVTLTANPRVTIAFLRLPDGNVQGDGFTSTGNATLKKLWQGTISQIAAIDGTSTYTLTGLIDTLNQLVEPTAADKIATQDFVGAFLDGDHSDHHATGFLMQAAGELDPTPHTLSGYMDYASSSQPANVVDPDLSAKRAAWFSYTPFDFLACQTPAACDPTSYGSWLQRQYITKTLEQPRSATSTNVAPLATATASSQNPGTSQYASNAIDGVVDGWPGDYTKEWATNSGGAGSWISLTWAAPQTLTSITLHDRPNTNDQVTAGTITFSDGSTLPVPSLPNDGTGLTLTFPAKTVTGFQLTITGVSSSTSSIGLAEIEASTGTVGPPPPPPPPTPSGTNVAPIATVTVSSENTDTGQTGVKAIDGSPLGYPADYSHEWATLGQSTAAWIQLTWTTPQALSSIVLNDRPNLNDQITGGTITFSDGSTVAVPSLTNNGGATTITFASKTVTSIKLTVTTTSSTTENIGLAEISAITT